ncbi:Uncharacterised protein [Mycolicibacterium vanbaalenii]|uniref:Transmembrane protein n=2 Tax=Mycolicibacterium vanbaalenii TaxID=110539 RepID=A0A5S9R8E1_MYCVN|nr:hypothetical protein [Mycolicibacterium vanbaalenii]CAA0136134.1 Uncharacterised protein [Mycolicibacterium vanbaalenii]
MRPRSGVDLAISIVAMVLTVLLGAAAAFFGLFSLAFLDHCPPSRCSVDGAVSAVFTSLLAVAGIGLVGIVLTIVLLALRRTGWPVAVGTLVLCALAVFAGGLGYGAAVG